VNLALRPPYWVASIVSAGPCNQVAASLHADEFVLVNRIEAQFTALRYSALHDTDHTSHKEQAGMIRRYIIGHNNGCAENRRTLDRLRPIWDTFAR
jgi:hypothetical protein